MGKTKLTFENIFIFLFLIIFPFGQIIRIGMLQPIDLIAGLAAIYVLLSKTEKPNIFKYFENFLIIASFSWIVGAAIFMQKEVFYGLLYLLRLFAYFYFFIYIWNFAKKNSLNKKLLENSLIAVSVISSIFGWIQYFAFPTIKPFTVWGWDDHLFRLVGTFLDPTFLGIIIVFGLILTIYRFIKNRQRKYLLIGLFLLVSLAFTYSRASYLAFLGGIVFLGLFQKRIKQFILIILGLIALIAVLPTSGNHVLAITRAFSAVDRIENYIQTVDVIKFSPVFGVGYDNLCLARSKITGFMEFESHSCSGSDSSILFIGATMGIVGLIVLVYFLWNVGRATSESNNVLILGSSFTALLIHSVFSNSLVYPWVLGWILILLALNLGREA